MIEEYMPTDKQYNGQLIDEYYYLSELYESAVTEGAVNIFLRQVILHGGLPFEVKYPQYKAEVLEAMEEAKALSHNPETKRYKSFEDALLCSKDYR